MLKNILQLLENPKYPSVGPHLYLLGFTGLWHPKISLITKKQIIFYVCILFFFSQYAKCLYKLDADSLKLILKLAPFHMGIVKSCFFQKQHRLWEKLLSCMAKVECKELEEDDLEVKQIIKMYIQENRRVTYFFWALAFFSNIAIFSEPYHKGEVVGNYFFDGYTPFENELPGRYASLLIQTLLGLVVSAYVVGWDTLVVSIMIFYAGQLKIARIYAQQLIEKGNEEQSHRNISEFHRFYIRLIKYQRLFNLLISRVLFVYLIVISVNLGVCIIQIVELQDNLTALISSAVFVIACLIQLLNFYWHSNEVTIESTSVSFAVYSGDWLGTSKSLQKEVTLLCITTTKVMTFDAGPFNKMSLSTFIAILRASYSFFTLLKGTN